MFDSILGHLSQNTSGMAVATDTVGFLAMCADAERHDSNRQVDIPRLTQAIDPDGTHVLAFQMMHNGREWRTQWLVKLTDEDAPAKLWLDVSFSSFEAAVRLKDPATFYARPSAE